MVQPTGPPQDPVYKKRRLQGACDICKRKKIRCNSSTMPDNRCSNCMEYNSECTHSGPRKRSHPYQTQTTHTNLTPTVQLSQDQTSPQCAQSAISQGDIHPRIQSILSTSVPLAVDLQNSLLSLSQYITKLEQELALSNYKLTQAQLQTSNSALPSDSSQQSTSLETHEYSQSEDDSALPPIDEADLSWQVKRLTIGGSSDTRHFGPSSSFSLLGAALKVGRHPQVINADAENNYFRRPQFWNIPKWEAPPQEIFEVYQFPDRDFLKELVGLYFDHVNPHFPLFHRPTYEKLINDEVYLTDRHFGSTVLGVCALAARYSNDPRVLLDGVDSWHSAGWKWHRQIRRYWLSSSRTLSLYEIQSICLTILFTCGTYQPEACWVIVGIGVRYAQDVGAHRKRANETPTVESELWKRCFWVLVCMDTTVCSFVGRPRATVYDDIDLDYPIDCDDEYWETDDPTSRFVQPPGKPTVISGFIAYLRLQHILEYAQRNLYAVNKAKRFCGTARGLSDKDVVAHLDSELNQWISQLPEHLKWESCTPGTTFYQQSTMLHACYYHVQILVHRPFIPAPNQPSRFNFPSLEICTHAARSCAGTLRNQMNQPDWVPFPQIQLSVFTSAIILLMNYWTKLKITKPKTIPRELTEDMKSIHDCIKVLSLLEDRWTPSGRLCDVIREISSYGDLPPVASMPAAQTNSIPEGNCASKPLDDTIPPITNNQLDFTSSNFLQDSASFQVPDASQASWKWNPTWASDAPMAKGDIQDTSGQIPMNPNYQWQWSEAQGLSQRALAGSQGVSTYMTDTQGTPQWPTMMPIASGYGMDDVAMILDFLQQPESGQVQL